MVEKRNYNTKSRRYINEYLYGKKESTVSATDIIEYLNSKGVAVNPATVYRYLNKLNLERKVIKFTDKETQTSVYQVISNNNSCDEHIHIKCKRCGKLSHLDCGFMEDFSNHLSDHHGFSLQCEGSILYGICKDCKDK